MIVYTDAPVALTCFYWLFPVSATVSRAAARPGGGPAVSENFTVGRLVSGAVPARRPKLLVIKKYECPTRFLPVTSSSQTALSTHRWSAPPERPRGVSRREPLTKVKRSRNNAMQRPETRPTGIVATAMFALLAAATALLMAQPAAAATCNLRRRKEL